MKQTKLVLVLMFLVFLVFLVGCNSSEDVELQDFKTGIFEVELNLLDNSPPDKIYPNSNFKIVADVHNMAGYDMHNGEVKVVGLTDEYFIIDQEQQSITDLEGRGLTNPEGDKEFKEFSVSAGQLFLNAEQRNEPFFLKVSYDSTMEFSDTICINPNLYEVYQSGCKVEDHSSYAGQGAPLVVTDMEEIISPGENPSVEFRLFLKNQGVGKVDMVRLEGARLGGKEIVCRFEDVESVEIREIKFDEKKQEAVLICNEPLDRLSSYSTTFFTEFSYSYSFKEKHTLTLVNSAFRK